MAALKLSKRANEVLHSLAHYRIGISVEGGQLLVSPGACPKSDLEKNKLPTYKSPIKEDSLSKELLRLIQKHPCHCGSTSELIVYVFPAGDLTFICKECDEGTARFYELQDMTYREYLETYEWRTIRQEMVRRAGWKCQVCNSSKKLHVHHRDYERRGLEACSDLIVLCAACHYLFHQSMWTNDKGRGGHV